MCMKGRSAVQKFASNGLGCTLILAPRRLQRCFLPPFSSLLLLTGPTGPLQRGRAVEMLESQSNCPFPRHYHVSFPARFGMDPWWKPNGLHYKTCRCKSARSRGYPSHHVSFYSYPRYPRPRYTISLKAFTIFTPAT